MSTPATKATFNWADPLLLDDQLSADERAVRDAARAYAQGKLQEAIMDRVMADPLITENWNKLDYEDIINQMETAKAV